MSYESQEKQAYIPPIIIKGKKSMLHGGLHNRRAYQKVRCSQTLTLHLYDLNINRILDCKQQDLLIPND